MMGNDTTVDAVAESAAQAMLEIKGIYEALDTRITLSILEAYLAGRGHAVRDILSLVQAHGRANLSCDSRPLAEAIAGLLNLTMEDLGLLRKEKGV